jgi:transposase
MDRCSGKVGSLCAPAIAKALKQDRDAIRNAIVEPWSSGQVEGQINRLKTIKRSMYVRGGIGLLRTRLLPLSQFSEQHI